MQTSKASFTRLYTHTQIHTDMERLKLKLGYFRISIFSFYLSYVFVWKCNSLADFSLTQNAHVPNCVAVCGRN